MCISCNQSAPSVLVKKSKNIGGALVCDYTTEQAEQWRTKIICVVNNNLFTAAGTTKAEMNSFLGVINSVVVYNNNPCSYSSTFEKIYDFIIRLVNLGLCL